MTFLEAVLAILTSSKYYSIQYNISKYACALFLLVVNHMATVTTKTMVTMVKMAKRTIRNHIRKQLILKRMYFCTGAFSSYGDDGYSKKSDYRK